MERVHIIKYTCTLWSFALVLEVSHSSVEYFLHVGNKPMVFYTCSFNLCFSKNLSKCNFNGVSPSLMCVPIHLFSSDQQRSPESQNVSINIMCSFNLFVPFMQRPLHFFSKSFPCFIPIFALSVLWYFSFSHSTFIVKLNQNILYWL